MIAMTIPPLAMGRRGAADTWGGPGPTGVRQEVPPRASDSSAARPTRLK